MPNPGSVEQPDEVRTSQLGAVLLLAMVRERRGEFQYEKRQERELLGQAERWLLGELNSGRLEAHQRHQLIHEFDCTQALRKLLRGAR